MQFSLKDAAKANLFPWSGFGIEHDLYNNPLLEISQIIELSKTLPENSVEYNAGDLPIEQDPQKTPHNGLSIQDTLHQIEHCDSWMVLKNIEQDPKYKRLLDDALDSLLRNFNNKALKKTGDREAFIFVSSPNSMTPFHIDPEHNFLLQIKGSKTMHQWDWRNREVLPEIAIENTVYGDNMHRNLKYKEEFISEAQSFELQPGDGLYVPVHAPHWVRNGKDVSISLSITFRSDFSRRNAYLYGMNARQREQGKKPFPVGESLVIDYAKYFYYKVKNRISK